MTLWRFQPLVLVSILTAGPAWAYDTSFPAEAQPPGADRQNLLAKQSSGRLAAVGRTGREEKERAAKKACLTGDPVAGVVILTDLYLDSGDPTYLFNQGRCFEQNRRYEDAIGRFREYLEKAKNLSAEEKADTQRHIATCQSYLREQSVEKEGRKVPSVAVEKPPVAETGSTEVVVGSGAPSTGRPGTGLRIAGGIVAGLGVAGLVTGLVLNLKVNGMSSDLEADWNPGTNSTREDYKTAGWIAYGAGAACVAGGMVLYYLGWRRAGSAASVAVIPTVGPEMAGTLVVGSF
jgi:hypothetical protein